MFKENYNVIGVMSGTSLDGVDLACIKFNYSDHWTFEIGLSETVSYSNEWVTILKKAIHYSEEELQDLNVAYTKLLASIIFDFISKNNLSDIDAVCSHGHTILHQPQNGLTLQIGNLPMIRDLVNQTIVCDFRVQDVALGGQGAPLVPIGDEKLFSEYDCCLNLGGIANISLKENQKRLALDVAPFNLVINQLVASLGWLMDKDGEEANRGVVNEDLLTQLNKVSFYSIKGVKSLGKEYIDANFSFIHTSPISLADKLCTFNHHVAFQINKLIAPKVRKVLITGGGAYNKHFINCLNTINSNTDWFVPSKETVDFKEALIFAFLGYLRVNNQINIYNSYTGAQKNSIAGHLVKG